MPEQRKASIIKGDYYAHGKVLLTAEYAVLDGARALALPTKYGQSLSFKKSKSSDIHWISKDKSGETWFSAQISLFDFTAVKTTDEQIAERLRKLLKNAVRLNSEFLSKWNGFRVETSLEFPRNWGLGSSSTLTFLVAQWADVHPLLLHFKFSNGSGYDVACAGADGPISYQLKNDEINWSEIDFDPGFKENIHFIHLEQKQNTDSAIKNYSKQVKNKKAFVKESNDLTDAFESCTSLGSFIELIDEHEKVVSKYLGEETVKSKKFKDFDGAIKSLGAWGGDFILAASKKDTDYIKSYFSSKGFNTVIPYSEFIL